MFCSNCGTKLGEGSAFCKECGSSVKKAVAPVPKKRRGNPRTVIAILVFIAMAGLLWHEGARNCEEPLKYSIGSVDSRFGVSSSEIISVLDDSEYIWESAAGRDLFMYDASSSFEINFVYDERQESIQKFNEAVELGEEYDSLEEEYEHLLSVYNSRLAGYNSDVDYWNSAGGAPNSVYYRLQAEKRSIISLGNRIDRMADQLNEKADDINKDIESYNSAFGEENDVAYYFGDKIEVYAFYDKNDLKLTLAHELGHYRGISHVEGSQALMYPLDLGQYNEDFNLAPEDISALKRVCNLD